MSRISSSEKEKLWYHDTSAKTKDEVSDKKVNGTQGLDAFDGEDSVFDLGKIFEEDVHVTGTLIWYYYICERQVWLMVHQINPDEDDPNIEYGRFLQRTAYSRLRKEQSARNFRIDVLSRSRNGRMIVVEVKKSSRFLKSATMQLLFYLKELSNCGIQVEGEIRIPEEKKKMPVSLTASARQELREAESKILAISQNPVPPKARKSRWCRNCGYREFCWS